MFGFHRLDHANLESFGQRAFTILRASEARQRHRKHIGLRDELANSADKFVAVDGWHADVAEQDLRRAVGNLGERFLGGRSGTSLRAILPQELGQHFAGVRLVIDDQYRNAFELSWLCHGLSLIVAGGCCLGLFDRQSDREGGPLARAIARGFHSARMQFDQMTHNREPETQAAVRASAAAVGLAESVEDVRQEILRNSLAGIAHGERQILVMPFDPNCDPAVARRELDRVRKQVPDDLLSSIRVAADFVGSRVHLAFQREAFGVGGRAHR